MKKIKSTIEDNYVLILDENENAVAVEKNGNVAYRLLDRVEIIGDFDGYISSEICCSVTGVIIEICRDGSDILFGVETDNDIIFVKEEQISLI